MLNRLGVFAARYHRAVVIASALLFVVVAILRDGALSGCSRADLSVLRPPLLRPRRLLRRISVVNRGWSFLISPRA